MTIFNLIVMYPLSREALAALKDYEERLKEERKEKNGIQNKRDIARFASDTRYE